MWNAIQRKIHTVVAISPLGGIIIYMLLQRLREQTWEQHQRLDSGLALESRLATVPGYRHLLTRFYGWWIPWESRVLASKKEEIVRFFQDRRKQALIEADLSHLGMSRGEIEQLPLCRIAERNTTEELLGTMYVTEGSTLGGQFIARMIEKKLGFTEGHGYSFYRSYGAQVSSRWREFGSFVEAQSDHLNADEVVRAAQNTFEEIRVWLDAKS